ncbi:unnamed protein product [Moneuplotes crassus]|uniref:Ion transport domain-containing protein n=1 Tax=Euplotes crassus TaxID=5936 RepID=A0AAD2DAR7_EUPCR|nr:unnamed protein product [Moneuplotes crassus]
MVDSIVSNMYLGPYERELFLNKSTCFKVIEEEIMSGPQSKSLVTKSFRIFEYGNCLGSLRKQFSNLKIFRGLQEQNYNETFGEEEGTGDEVGHMYQYKIWKRSLDVKLIVNLIFILIICILLQIYSFLMIRQMDRVTEAKTTLDNLISANGDTTQAYKDVKSEGDTYLHYSMLIFVLNCFTVGYLIQDFQVMIYLNLRKKYANTYTWLLLINLVSTLIYIIRVLRFAYHYNDDLSSEREEIRAAVQIQRMRDDDVFNFKAAIAIPVSLQFARLVYALQVNRTFGPMVKIITSMIVDVIRFLILFAAMFFIFIGAGQILFSELDEFSDLENSMKTLFASAIGEFEFGTYDDLKDVDPKVGYIFVTAFIIIANIMLLNFLIAILSTTYSELNDVKNGLYMRKVIQFRQKYNYDRKYASIVFAPVPLNMIIFLFVPLLMMGKHRINEIFLVVEYSIVFISSIFLFFICSVIMCPVSYVLILLFKFKYIFQNPRKNWKDVMFRICDFILFIFIGIPFILVWVFIDTFKFAVNQFSKRIMLIDKSERTDQSKLNEQMDGSIQTKHTSSINFTRKNEFQVVTQPKFRPKTNNKMLNPLKEGLSDTTFKILNACCRMMLEDFEEKSTNVNEITTTFIPTISILEKMREILLVQEQLNAILMGVSYTKSTDFFYSDTFHTLVENILGSEKEGNILGDAYEEEEEKPRDMIFKRQSTLVDRDVSPMKWKYWSEKIIGFLTQSNEKWILDQFNLCKRFLLQNSIEGTYEDFSHPFYNNFGHIKSMKVKNPKKKMYVEDTAREMFTAKNQNAPKDTQLELQMVDNFELSREKFIETPQKIKKRKRNSNYTSGNRASDPQMMTTTVRDEKLMKCDIAALLKAIEEIEKRLRMEKILNKNEKGKDGSLVAHVMDDNTVKALRNQFSMLNFNRNFKAVLEALQNPSSYKGSKDN